MLVDLEAVYEKQQIKSNNSVKKTKLEEGNREVAILLRMCKISMAAVETSPSRIRHWKAIAMTT